MKLSWRRHQEPVSANPNRTLTGPERAAALGVADESEPELELEPAVAASVAITATSAVGVGSPVLASTSAAPSGPKPVMLTLTTRGQIEQAEQEAAQAAAQPVRRRMERGMFGGSTATGGGCSSGGCG
ncbi:hypothetical protein MXD59_03635 [Frankia sp. Ag45/Mut15]|uniref:Uncharacterized protein n=1 Tax=Frankia umida TaxID=573489 RepID=A0ABT0JTV0_9ACTN|nr:hypothetical protein [Frankia umida]MCK9874881.1 hypothetical protein [Frankia umida]